MHGTFSSFIICYMTCYLRLHLTRHSLQFHIRGGNDLMTNLSCYYKNLIFHEKVFHNRGKNSEYPSYLQLHTITFRKATALSVSAWQGAHHSKHFQSDQLRVPRLQCLRWECNVSDLIPSLLFCMYIVRRMDQSNRPSLVKFTLTSFHYFFSV